MRHYLLILAALITSIAYFYPEINEAVEAERHLVTAAGHVETKCEKGYEFTQRQVEYGWAEVEKNPLPVGFALGTFLLTVVYHKVKGKSLRKALEIATTRVNEIDVARDRLPYVVPEKPQLVKRAEARATRNQLIFDQINVETRLRALPTELRKAQRETCYSEKELTDAKEKLKCAEEKHCNNLQALDALTNEQTKLQLELVQIGESLNHLKNTI